MPIQRYFLSDFVSIQRQSFLNLLEKGLIEEFSKRNPITNERGDLELLFYPEYYILTRPEYNPQEAILKNKSYTSKLFVPAQLTDKMKQKRIFKWVYIGNMPLMTKRGHFILNGAARVIVNQILRSPGIYYQEKIYETYEEKWSQYPEESYKRYYADLICMRGTWLRIEMDKDKNIWAQMKKGPKIPIYWFLLGMGLSERTIFKKITDSFRLLGNLENPNAGSQKKVENLKKKKKVLESYMQDTPEDFENDNFEKSNLGEFKRKKKFKYIKNPPEAWQEIYALISQKRVKESQNSNQKLPALTNKNNQGSVNVRSQNPIQNVGKVNSTIQEKGKEIKNYTEEGRIWFYNKFMNPRSYDLGKTGRLAFNKKLGLDIPKNQLTLTALDVLYATDHLIKVEKGISKIDDIDHLKNRRVRTSGELIQIQTGVGLVRLEKSIREALNKFNFAHISHKNVYIPFPGMPKPNDSKLNKNKSKESHLSLWTNDFSQDKELTLILNQSSKNELTRVTKKQNKNSFSIFSKTPSLSLGRAFEGTSELEKIPRKSDSILGLRPKISLSSFVNSKAFNSAIREFFGTSPLSQFMDQINPLAELTHKRRLSSMGPGGVTRDNATLAIRGIHPTHYGRICPIETPEGKNTGLVNSMTTYARVNPNGIIESPFYKIYKGQVQKNAGMYYFSAEQEEKIKLVAADVFVSSIGFLPKSLVPARITGEFTKINRPQAQYIGVSPLQMISIATSLIPFLEHDDANRALMGSNMQRQAVPLIKPERPIVGTGLEARTVSDSGHVLISKWSGLVTYASSRRIIVYTFQ